MSRGKVTETTRCHKRTAIFRATATIAFFLLRVATAPKALYCAIALHQRLSNSLHEMLRQDDEN
jgi:predicted transposase YbfD/YdcC